MNSLTAVALILLVGTSIVRAADPPNERRVDRDGDPLPAGAVARYGVMRLFHESARQLHFSPDGKLLASRSETELRVWDVKTGRLVRRVPGVAAAAFAPGGLIVAQGRDLRLIDATTGKVLRALDHRKEKAAAGAIAVVPDGKTVAVSWAGEGVAVYDLAAPGEVKPRPLCPEALNGICLSADRRRLAGFKEQTVQVWDVGAAEKLPTIELKYERKPDEVALALNADGSRLAVADALQFQVCSTATGKAFKAFKVESYYQRAQSLRFSPDGKTLTGLLENGVVVVWSANSGKEERVHGTGISMGVGALAEDGVTLALTYGGSGIQFLDVTTGKARELPDRDPPVGTVRFVEPGVVLSPTSEGYVFWDANDGKVRKRLEAPEGFLSPDAKYVARRDRGFPSKEVVVSELESGKVVSRLAINGTCHGFSPDGKMILTWLMRPEDDDARTRDVKYQLWDAASGRLWRTVAVPADVDEPAISPDGRTLAYYDEKDGVAFLETATGKVRETLHAPPDPIRADRWRENIREPEPRRHYQFSRDGRTLLVARNYDLFVISCKSRVVLIQLQTEEGAQAALSPDGRWLATPHGSAVKVRDLQNPRSRFEPHVFDGREGRVYSLSFSPDGRLLASAGGDGTAYVWDMRPLIEAAAKPPPAPDKKRLAEWWAALAGEPEKAGPAMLELESRPEQAVALAAARLAPAEAPEPERVAKWIAALDHDDFDRREEAAKELEKLAELAEPALREALKKKPSAELKRRAEALLERLDDVETAPERLQAFRAVEVLERIGSPAARKLLEELARGAPHARLTREAKASLQRWPKP
jgi:WD40 repeat protein